MKFRVAKRTHVPVSHAKFHVNRCNESPLRGESADFWPVSKFNTGRMPQKQFAALRHPADKYTSYNKYLHIPVFFY